MPPSCHRNTRKQKKLCKSRATATPIAERLVMFEHPAVMDTTPASIPLQSPPTSYLNGKQIWQGWHWYQMQVFDWQQLHGLLSPIYDIRVSNREVSNSTNFLFSGKGFGFKQPSGHSNLDQSHLTRCTPSLRPFIRGFPKPSLKHFNQSGTNQYYYCS